MTATHEASRTLVKSPPELWAELSDPGSLARHLGDFGEIRITRLEPETAVAWEGDRASGTVRLEPSGWGTRVVLTAIPLTDEVPAPPSPAPPPPAPLPDREPLPPAPLPDPEPLPPAARRPGVWARILRFLGGQQAPAPVESPAFPLETTDTAAGAAPQPETTVPPPALTASVPPPAPAATVAPPEPAADVAPPESAADTGAPEVTDPEADDPEAILSAALDSLGQAHHRPFSRS